MSKTTRYSVKRSTRELRHAAPGKTFDHSLKGKFVVIDHSLCTSCSASSRVVLREDYAFHLSLGSGEFASELDSLVAGTGLSVL